MKNYIILVFFSQCIINIPVADCQTNLIPNGGFEFGGNPLCSYTYSDDVYNIENWLFTCGTYDWWDIDWRTQNGCTSGTYALPNTFLSNRFVGIYGDKGTSSSPDNLGIPDITNESISTQLLSPLLSRGNYIFKAKVCLAGNQIDENPSFEIILSQNLEWWQSTGNKRIINAFTIDKNNLYNWIDISISFRLPFELDNMLDYIAIRGNESNPNCYLYMDDVILYNSCDHPCSPPEASLPLEWLNGNSPDAHNACAINGCMVSLGYPCDHGYPWIFEVKNATEVEFCVVSSWNWNDCLFYDHFYNENVLSNNVDPSVLDFQYIWNGYDNSFSKLPQGVYNYKITVKNCEYKYDYIGSITVININDDPAITFVYQSIDLNENCCKSSILLSGILPYNTYYQTSDYIGASDLTVTTGNNIVFDAGNTVHLGDGFRAKEGCFFNARINGCSSGQKTEIPNNYPKQIIFNNASCIGSYDSISFIVYPNMVSNSLFAEIKTSSNKNFSLSLVDEYGITKANLQVISNQIIDLSPFARNYMANKGMYFIILNDEERILVKKIIKM